MKIRLKDAVNLADADHKMVTPEDLSIILQYAILGLKANEIKEKINRKFTIETIRKQLQTYRLNSGRLNEPKIMDYLKNFDTSYAAGIEV